MSEQNTIQLSPSETLANFVWVFHMIVVCFILLAPFSGVAYLFLLHITFCLSLLVHWWGNSNVCSLSILESHLRGVDYTQSFTHKFVSPVYDISKTTWSTICYVIVIVLMCISIYNISKSQKWKQIKKCYNETSSNPDKLIRWKNRLSCLLVLFTR